MPAPVVEEKAAPSSPVFAASLLDGESLLEQFVWRMGHHGMSVSRRLMLTDPAYAVQQMAHARHLGDAWLNEMAGSLFARFQMARSGLLSVH